MRVRDPVDGGRLEQARVDARHRARGRDGGQIGGSLVLAAGAERLAERDEEEDADEQRGQAAKQEERGLAVLVPRSGEPRFVGRHCGATVADVTCRSMRFGDRW
jgi:hypothetical protein